MAEPNRIEDIDFDQQGDNNSGGNGSTPIGGSGGGSGGGSTGNNGDTSGGPNNPNSPDETFATTYNIYVKSDIFEASVLINGEDIYQFIPYTFQVTKEQLFTEGPITVEGRCEGYTNNEKYILSLGFPNEDGDNPSPVRVDGEVVGLSTAYLRVDYDDGSGLRQLNTEDSGTNTRNLEFSFEKRTGPPKTKLNTFLVKYSGLDVQNAVKITKNNSVEFYPEKGDNFYSDVDNTLFLIESTNTSLYRISSITVYKNSNKPDTIQAEKDESLTIDLRLDANYTIEVNAEKVPTPIEWVEPKVELLNNLKPYNINSKNDFPLLLRRNSAVTGVTVIVGDNVYEFKNIPKTPTFGLDIPAAAFEQIGNYNVRVVPFLLSEGRPQKPEGDDIEVVDIGNDDFDDNKELPNVRDEFETKEDVVSRPVDNPYNPYLPEERNPNSNVVDSEVLNRQINQL